MKKIVCVILILLVISFSCYALDVSAESAILYDCYTDTVVFEKNADLKRPMASTTKIMTGLIASTIYNVNQDVTIKEEWCGLKARQCISLLVRNLK